MRGLGLIASFDCLHNMGGLGALAHAHEVLPPGGTVMLVGPYASDDVASDLNPLGRPFRPRLFFAPRRAVPGCRGARPSGS